MVMAFRFVAAVSSSFHTCDGGRQTAEDEWREHYSLKSTNCGDFLSNLIHNKVSQGVQVVAAWEIQEATVTSASKRGKSYD